MKNKILKWTAAILTVAVLLIGVYTTFKETGKIDTDKINEAVETIVNTYEMSQEEIEDLPTKEIIEQTEQQENAQEQTVEDEGFELQGEIAYEGDRARSWNVELGDYKALVYYSQLDRKMVQ